VIRVAAGVAERCGRALVCRRSLDRRHPGKWEFPGGKLEAGETAEAALRRELREELGIEAEIRGEICKAEHRYAGLEPVELRFFAVGFDGEPRDEGHFAEVRWQPLDRLGELDFLEADRELVAALASGRINARGETSRATPPEGRVGPAPASTSGRSHAARRDR